MTPEEIDAYTKGVIKTTPAPELTEEEKKLGRKKMEATTPLPEPPPEKSS